MKVGEEFTVSLHAHIVVNISMNAQLSQRHVFWHTCGLHFPVCFSSDFFPRAEITMWPFAIFVIALDL